MRHIDMDIVVGTANVEDVFDTVLRWELPDPDAGSSWEWAAGASAKSPAITSGVRPRWLEFQSGMLRWQEEIRSFHNELEIWFTLTEGDFASFAGRWSIRQHGTDVTVRFSVDFDFGIPSMTGMLEPIAEQAVKDTIGRAVLGMFPQVHIEDPARALTAAATVSDSVGHLP